MLDQCCKSHEMIIDLSLIKQHSLNENILHSHDYDRLIFSNQMYSSPQPTICARDVLLSSDKSRPCKALALLLDDQACHRSLNLALVMAFRDALKMCVPVFLARHALLW
jgi:hypothetical protein